MAGQGGRAPLTPAAIGGGQSQRHGRGGELTDAAGHQRGRGEQHDGQDRCVTMSGTCPHGGPRRLTASRASTANAEPNTSPARRLTSKLHRWGWLTGGVGHGIGDVVEGRLRRRVCSAGQSQDLALHDARARTASCPPGSGPPPRRDTSHPPRPTDCVAQRASGARDSTMLNSAEGVALSGTDRSRSPWTVSMVRWTSCTGSVGRVGLGGERRRVGARLGRGRDQARIRQRLGRGHGRRPGGTGSGCRRNRWCGGPAVTPPVGAGSGGVATRWWWLLVGSNGGVACERARRLGQSRRCRGRRRRQRRELWWPRMGTVAVPNGAGSRPSGACRRSSEAYRLVDARRQVRRLPDSRRSGSGPPASGPPGSGLPDSRRPGPGAARHPAGPGRRDRGMRIGVDWPNRVVAATGDPIRDLGDPAGVRQCLAGAPNCQPARPFERAVPSVAPRLTVRCRPRRGWGRRALMDERYLECHRAGTFGPDRSLDGSSVDPRRSFPTTRRGARASAIAPDEVGSSVIRGGPQDRGHVLSATCRRNSPRRRDTHRPRPGGRLATLRDADQRPLVGGDVENDERRAAVAQAGQGGFIHRPVGPAAGPGNDQVQTDVVRVRDQRQHRGSAEPQFWGQLQVVDDDEHVRVHPTRTVRGAGPG